MNTIKSTEVETIEYVELDCCDKPPSPFSAYETQWSFEYQCKNCGQTTVSDNKLPHLRIILKDGKVKII